MTNPAPPPPARTRLPISRRKYIFYAAIAMTLSFALGLILLVAADLYLHRRAERSAGLNAWAYRGKVLGRKGGDEVRIAFLGGSTMFGYGVTSDEAIPALVEVRLNGPAGHVRSANLALNNEGAHSFLYTLQDYDYLNTDIVVLYEGYNDWLGDANGGNRSLLRHESAVFRLTGYYPILPVVLNERAMIFRYGDLETAYAAGRGTAPGSVFRPGLASRSVARALETASDVGESLGRQIGRMTPEASRPPDRGTEAGCEAPWSIYCQSIHRAVEYALSRGKRVAVGSQPLAMGVTREHYASQQLALESMLKRRFGADSRVIHIDLRDRIDLADDRLSFDGMHLTAFGNQVAADHFAEALKPVVAAARSSR